MVTNSSPHVTVFLGDALRLPSEQHFLERLRVDIGNVPTLVVANFFPEGARQPRQIDFLIRTPHRTVHVELKSLNESRPIRSGSNGDWVQLNPAGDDQEIGNPFRQARDGTYAISDSIRACTRGTSSIPAANYRDFETVVCLYPTIPPNSQIGHYNYVDIVAYQELLRRLTTPGRQLPWTPQTWDEYLRYLGVYRERDESSGARAVRAAAADVADYQARFGVRHTTQLHELVSLPALHDGQPVAPIEAVAFISEGETLALVGPSGLGKTHTALHAATGLTERGCTVIWARADEYDEGELGTLLARSVAPYTVDTALDLVRKTEQSGGRVVVVVDGFTGAAGEDRLLEQLAAFRLRHPAGLLLTSTVPLSVGNLSGFTVRLEVPDAAGRAALFESYAVNAGMAANAFTTPFEIAILGAINAQLPVDATPTLIHDAYISERAQFETVRAGLRALSFEMATDLRTTLRRPECRSILQRAAGLSPSDVDAVLTNGLLDVTQSRVRFRHDLHATFLAAEQLLLATQTGADLGHSLASARYQDLRRDAIAIEQDATRISDALAVIADPSLYAAAAGGELGPVAASQVRGEIVSVLVEAASNTNVDTLSFTSDVDAAATFLGGEWTSTRPLSAREIALLSAAGIRVWFGDFVDEIGTLLDHMDLVNRSVMHELHTLGHKQAISCVVAATYSGIFAPGIERTPATILAQACQQHARRFRHDRLPVIATQLAGGATARSWGRLYLGLELFNAESESSFLWHLVNSAWEAGGYHLRLHALYTVTLAVRSLDDATRKDIADLLETFDVSNNLGLSTTLIEALSAAGRIDPQKTIGDIGAEIAAVLSQPADPTQCAAASGIYGNQFEDDVIGPYAEAVALLDPTDRLTLLIMAASAHQPFWLASILEELATHLPTTDPRLIEVFRRHASRFPADRFMVNDAVDAYLIAVRGWARIDDSLPASAEDRDADERAWELVADLILRHERGGHAAGDPTRIWQRLLHEYAHAAIDVLDWCSRHSRHGDGPNYVAVLRDTYPAEFMQLIEWGLTHRDELTSLVRGPGAATSAEFLFSMLGRYGTSNTIGLLRPYVDDPVLGRAAVEAIREIEEREQQID